MRKQIKIINAISEKKRIIISQRENGTYFFETEFFSDDPQEKCWCPYHQNPIGIYDSLAQVEREARASVKWQLEEQEPNKISHGIVANAPNREN